MKASEVTVVPDPVFVNLIFAVFTSSFSFLFDKNDGAKNLIDAYIKSRSILFLPMIDNISNNVFFGIGFGVDSSLSDSKVSYDTTFNIPLSGSTEKGNILLLIFEELGIFGFILIAVALIKIALSLSWRNQTRMRLFLFIFLSNLGEATFFGLNGIGLFLLLILVTMFFYEPRNDVN